MKIKRVTIAPNPRKRWAHRLARELHTFLKKRGITVTHVRSSADLLITIGGDGTILHEKKHCEIPIFGIGSETSFVCQAQQHNWKQRLSKALKRPRLDSRTQLASWLNGKRLQDAMNEVFIRNSDYRVLAFDLRTNGKKFHFTADGVIFSTPTGSTAYAYSAGGAELKPHVRKYEIVGLAPYRRGFKPLVVNDHTESRLIVHTSQPAIARLESGNYKNLSLSFIRKVARALHAFPEIHIKKIS